MTATIIKAEPGFSVAYVVEHKREGRRFRALDLVSVIAWSIEGGKATPMTSDGLVVADTYFIEQPADRTIRNAPNAPKGWPSRYGDERDVLQHLNRVLGPLDGVQIGGRRVA